MRLRIQTPLARSESVSQLKRAITSVKSRYLAKRKKHLLKVVGRGLRSQRRSLLRKASTPKPTKPKVKSNQVTTQPNKWSKKKKLTYGLGAGGAGVGYVGYKATRPYEEEYY